MCYQSCHLCSRLGLCTVIRHCFQSCLVSFSLLPYKYLIHCQCVAMPQSSAVSVEHKITYLVFGQAQVLAPDIGNGNQMVTVSSDT